MNIKECEAVGVRPEDIETLEKKLRACGVMSRKLGVSLFGGSGSLSIRKAHVDKIHEPTFILGDVFEGTWDGGDGANKIDDKGLLRGE